MPPDPGPTEPHAQLERLHPHLRVLCNRASARARRLHADRVVVEHLVGAAMEDEESAAHAVAVHAFADPETISGEMLALSPGVMVVGSRASLPFSPLALSALRAARAAAVAASADEVACAVLLAESVAALPDTVRGDLSATGLDALGLAPTAGAGTVAADEPLFRSFSKTAKQAMSLASRAAHGAGEPTIGPARIVLGCLRAEPALEGTSGLSHTRAQQVLVGRTVDPSEPPPRDVPFDAFLIDFLGRLPAGGDSLDLLSACHALGSPELRELLGRHKVSVALLERSRNAFGDPPAPA